MKNLPKLVMISACAVALISCSQNVKKTIGIAHSGPDEYSVIKNKPLEMPPHFDINEIEKTNSDNPSSTTSSENLNPAEKALLKAINNK